jgi:gliding motility-associated-like protein
MLKRQSIKFLRKLFVWFLAFNCWTGSSQNSMTGDGFGGRLWYKPYNYTVGSYSAYTICGDSLQLYGWGDNSFGELGDGTKTSTSAPVRVKGMDHVKYYSTGYLMGAIKTDASAWVWGYDNLTPIKVLDSVKYLDAGMTVVSYVKKDGSIWSVGSNGSGSFGNDTINYFMNYIPQKMKGINNAVRVSNGGYSNLILLADSTLMVCGTNYYGLLGQGNLNMLYKELRPVTINGLRDIVDIKSITANNLALDKNGDVYVWGNGSDGANGNGTLNSISTPTKINGLKNIVAISGCNDGEHFLALDKNKNCYVWGRYNRNVNSVISTPVIVATDVVEIMAGETFSYIIKSDGTLWCSGYSRTGSIWLNVDNISRKDFTKIDPSVAPFNLCTPVMKCTYKINRTYFICENDSLIINKRQYKVSGNYSDTLYSSYKCDTIFNILITKFSKSNSTQSLKICYGESINVGKHTYINTGNYQDTISNWHGCDSIISTQLIIDCGYRLYNVFTPNNDGKNDLYEISGDLSLKYNLQIYNRWGELVYQIFNTNISNRDGFWNGNYMNKGKACPDGTYYYLFKPQDNEHKTINGVVELIR